MPCFQKDTKDAKQWNQESWHPVQDLEVAEFISDVLTNEEQTSNQHGCGTDAALIVCNRGGRLTGWSLNGKDWNQQRHQQAAQNHKWKAHSGVVRSGSREDRTP